MTRPPFSQYPHPCNPVIFIRVVLILFCSPVCLPGHSARADSLNVAITVKENAEVGAIEFPISFMAPLPQDNIPDSITPGIAEVPSQTGYLELWRGNLRKRHVLINFQPSVDPHGDATYHLTNGGNIQPASPVILSTTTDGIVVTTGPLRFFVSGKSYNLLDQVWLDQNHDGKYESNEEVISSSNLNGGVFMPRTGAGSIQYDSAYGSLGIRIEERGPLRVVIRIEKPARFNSTTDHQHGFAYRIYAYAGKSFVKIDYQLQNSDKNVVRSWPLYFESLNLDYRLNLDATPTIRIGMGDGSVYTAQDTGGLEIRQDGHNHFSLINPQTQAVLRDSGIMTNGTGPDGFIDVSDNRRGVMAAVRNFWQTWPNGLSVNDDNKLSIQLFPDWSAQWVNGQFTPSGLYWIEDMQHYVKETLLYFHDSSVTDTQLIHLARTFQFPPVAVLPASWYRQTHATLDMGGVIPPDSTLPAPSDQRQPVYYTDGFDPADWYNATGSYYGAGWGNFYDPEPGYRSVACTPGGWPYSGAGLIASGNPGDFYRAQGWARAEINLRPEWMAGYNYSNDWNQLRLTENPYCGGRWRIYEGSGISKLAAPPLPDTGTEDPVYFARDDQHAWFYHDAEYYWLSGDPWIRDWYDFILEFRQDRLLATAPFPDHSSRAIGHALNHYIQAYRITRYVSSLSGVGDYIQDHLRPDQDPLYGDQKIGIEPTGGGFQTGYLMRAVINYLEEVRERKNWSDYVQGFSYLSGLMEWNYNFGNFPYYHDARAGGTSQSSGTALTLADPVAWYYWHTGKRKYLDHLDQYVNNGINNGERPYGEFNQWRGQFEGRYYLFVKNTPRPDSTPPPAITDLAAVDESNRSITLYWTAPPGAVRYQVVWSTKPIVEANSIDPNLTNWWAASTMNISQVEPAGTLQSHGFYPNSSLHQYVAIFSFDESDNMSAMSNVAQGVPRKEASFSLH